MPFAAAGLLLGRALLLLAGFHVLPALFAWGYGEVTSLAAFAGGGLLTAFAGGLLSLTFRDMARGATKRDFLLCAILGLPLLSCFAALPMMLSGALPSLGAAAFEALSALTTTGASVIPDLERTSKAVLFWRALLAGLGGLAVIGFAIAVAPALDLGGASLTRNMLPHGEGERLTVRLRGVVRPLIPVYVGFIFACMLALWAAGMPAFDALCHALATLSTSGFSTRNDSIVAFQSPAVELVLIPFMILGALNFTFHWAFLHGRRGIYGADHETRGFFLLIGLGILVVFTGQLAHLHAAGESGFWNELRISVFTAVSAGTTTGFSGSMGAPLTLLGVYLMTALIFTGGSTGSTSGGLKVMRVILLIRHGLRELARLTHPRGVVVVRLNEKIVTDQALSGIWGLYVLFLAALAFLTIAFSATGADLSTSFFLSLSAITNSGPMILTLDPEFAGFPRLGTSGRGIYCIGMIVGRLEIMALLAALTTSFWRN